MQEENISGQESFAIIESMINKAKNQFSESGHLYLLWGWAVFICSLSQFILMNFLHYEQHYIVWFSMWLVLIYQIIYLRKERRQKRVRTYTDEIIGFVWIAFFILMLLFGFLFGKLFDPNKYYAFIDPAFLALYGMPTFLSGIILKFRPLILGGICCWLLSILATFISPQYHLLLVALAMIIAWIIPGYMLRKKYKQQTP
jgi:hypothetical protein